MTPLLSGGEEDLSKTAQISFESCPSMRGITSSLEMRGDQKKTPREKKMLASPKFREEHGTKPIKWERGQDLNL
jgi:hypothetical protein